MISNINTVCHRCYDKVDPALHDREACDEVLFKGLIKNQVEFNKQLVFLKQTMVGVINAIKELDTRGQTPKIHIVGQDPSNPVERNQ